MTKAPKQAKKQAPVPSVLAFSRKIEPSDGLMQAGLWSETVQDLQTQSWQNIELHDKRNRATKSQYGVADEEKIQPNIVWGDDANLPHDLDTLSVYFTVKFLGDIAKPAANNRPEFGEKLKIAIDDYIQKVGFKPLALRYAQNLANARFLWRNRINAKQVLVQIYDVENPKQSWEFNALDVPFNDFTQEDKQLEDLATYIAESFKDGKYLLLGVRAFAKMGFGQRIFPSQEMRDKDKETNKSKFLYQIKTKDGLCAGLHSEKIGNAIRTIDTWYKSEDGVQPVIAVEPYGSVPTQSQAYRTSKTDLYSLMVNWLDGKDVSLDDKHFVVANLIRGGVFGGNDS
ncbi:type I-F CRISPR-associated protein Csy3 [Moraxella catarrhalis]|uniref:type I-F CRISPR-associated protein Csy3 n=1 Tax=Moraxella catarrhalis TaxID=480 RepID=UPI0007E42329|nr:type I-F CRISPR-associated protein Csy3 [Moraxella catarrhalis]OAV07803.1 CRISPR-associated protein, Csy3 family [Moraxella catarrhalis]